MPIGLNCKKFRLNLREMRMAVPSPSATMSISATSRPASGCWRSRAKKSGGNFLIDQTRLVANDVTGKVITGSGHWLVEETPNDVPPC